MIEKMIASGSRDPFHWYARAMELRGMGEAERALEAYGDVAREFPDYVPTYLMAGQVAQELGDTEGARGWLTEGQAKARAAGDQHALSELTALLESL